MPTHDNGFSLVELLLALLLSSLLILGTGQLFIGINAGWRLAEGQFRLRENAWLALHFIADGIRSAGFLGCNSRPLIQSTLPGGLQAAFEFDIAKPLAGIGGVSGGWERPLHLLPIAKPHDNGRSYIPGNGIKMTAWQQGAVNAPAQAGLPVPDSDILIVRRMSGALFRLAEPVQADAEPVLIIDDLDADGSSTLHDLNNFDIPQKTPPILMISDCRQATVFRATDIKVTGNRARLAHAVAGIDTAFTNADATLTGTGYVLPAYAGGINTSLFYVATGSGRNNRQQAVLSLWRKQGAYAPQELVAGIERLRFFLGLDTSGDKAPNTYVPLSASAPFHQVVTVRVWLAANSLDAVGAELLRRAFVRTVQLKNA